jgi:hypothetical protein
MRIAVISLLASVGLASLTAQSTRRVVHLDVTDRHPMSVIAQRIELATGVPISYEEAPIEDPQDLQDMTQSLVDPDYLKMHPSHKLLLPREIQVKADIDLNEGNTQRARAEAALRAVQELPALKSYGMKFQTISMPPRIVLVPVQHRTALGGLAAAPRPLDQIMSYDNSNDANLERTLAGLAAAISRATGVQIDIGDIPINTMVRLHTTVKARSVSARSLIQLALDNAESTPGNQGPVFTWRLVYIPGAERYFIHFLIAAKSSPAPLGGTVNVPITRRAINQ